MSGIASGQTICGPGGCPLPGLSAVTGQTSAMHPAVAKVVSTRGRQQKHGSGTLVDCGGGIQGAGLVVTCAHVLCSGFDTVVVFPSGVRCQAAIVATDALHDCALLRIQTPADVRGMPLAGTYARVGEMATWAGYGGQAGYASGTASVAGYRGDWLAARGRVRNGDSGGPLCTARGLVGVVCEVSQAPGEPWMIHGPQVLWIRSFIRQRAPEFLRNAGEEREPSEERKTEAPPSGGEVTAVESPARSTALTPQISTLAGEVRSVLQRLDRFAKAKEVAETVIRSAEATGVKEVIKRAAPAAAARWAPWLLPALAGASTGPVGWALVVGVAALWRRTRKSQRRRIDGGKRSESESAFGSSPFVSPDRPSGGAGDDFPRRLPRDNVEAEQFLRLSRLEGRDPVHDALVGRLAYDELDKWIEKDGSEAGFARDLKKTLQDRFNAFVPLAMTWEGESNGCR